MMTSTNHASQPTSTIVPMQFNPTERDAATDPHAASTEGDHLLRAENRSCTSESMTLVSDSHDRFGS